MKRSIDPWPGHRLRLLIAGLLFADGVFVLAIAAVAWSPAGSTTAVWWPAAGLSVAIVAKFWRNRRSLISIVIVASAAANLAGGRGLPISIGFALSNGLEAGVAGWLLCRRSGRPALRELEDFWRLVGAAALGAAMIATGAATTVALFSDGGFLAVWRVVAASHGAAVLILVPLMMVVDPQTEHGRVERLAQWVLTLGMLLVVFAPHSALPVAFVVLPFAVWGALRFSVRTTSLQLAVIAVVAVLSTSEGRGPFSTGIATSALQNPNTAGAMTQVFLISFALVLLPLAVVVAQRQSALAEISSREDMFRQGFRQSLLGMMLLRRVDGVLRIAELNERAAAMLGETPQQLMGSDWLELIQGGVDGAEHLNGCDQWHGEIQLDRGAGSHWLEVAMSPIKSSANTNMFTVQLVDITSRRETEAILSTRASCDSLTGLANRSHFLEQLAERLSAGDSGRSLAVLFLDIDDFKNINDSAGHRTGDAVLVEVAHRLATVMRPHDILARLGGDEFVVLSDDIAVPSEAEAIADRLIAAVGHTVAVNGYVYPVGVSIGIALSSPDCNVEDLMSNADNAMYVSKAAGKHRTTLFAEAHRARVVRAVRLQPELRQALDLNQFLLYVQPIVDITTEAIVAGEALVRWQHPTEGLLGPDEWLDVAEASGLMPALGQWILTTACQIAADWLLVIDGEDPLRIHVNVSARQLDSGNFGRMVADALHAAQLPPERLAIEFTETHLAQVRPELLRDLHELTATGVCLAADDYGTGYSPLTRITELPVNMVKIDKQFVAHMLTDQRSMAIVQALVGLGNALHLDVVAEGVETRVQANVLRELGCCTGQGYLWSRPLPAHRFLELLAAQHSGHAPRPATSASRSTQRTS